MIKKLLVIFVIAATCEGYLVDKPILGIPLNPEHDLSRGLVGIWIVNENTGPAGIAYDLSGNARHGTLTDDAFSTPGIFGSVVDYDGDDDSIYMGHPNLVGGGTKMSLVVWAKNRSGTLPTNNPAYFVRQGNSGGNRVLTLRWDTGQNVRFEVWNDSASQISAQLTDGIQDSEWHQIVGVVDGINVKVFVDCIVGGTVGTWSGVIDTDQGTGGDDGFRLGASFTGGLPIDEWDGQIGYVLVYTRALSVDDMVNLLSDPFQMFEQERLVVVAVAEAEEYSHVMIIMGSIPWLGVLIAFSFWNSKRKTV